MTKPQTTSDSSLKKRTYLHDLKRKPALPTAFCFLSLCGVMAAWSTPRANAATITVTSTADNSTDDADVTLREAIISINNGANVNDEVNAVGAYGTNDTIVFAGAVTGTIMLGGTQLEITAPVTISGPGQSNLAVSGNNASRVLSISGGTAETPVRISGLTITAGDSTSSPNPNTGGAISTDGFTSLASVTVSNSSSPGAGTTAVGGGGIFNSGTLAVNSSLVTGNTATNGLGNGGGILNTGTLGVSDSTISSNQAGRAGGGIETNGGTVTLNGVNLSSNQASVNGGGLHTTGAGSVTVTGGVVQSNTATQEGGGLWNSAVGAMIVDTVEIRNNEALGNAADQGGGGIYNDGGTVTVTSATISGNSATGTSGSGGGIFNNAGTVDVSSTKITGNSANRAGGGIETNAGTVTLNEVTLGEVDILQVLAVSLSGGNTTGAAPGNGGGLHTTGAGDVTLNGGSVQGNSASSEGGGLWNSATGTLKVNGTNISSNTAQGSAADQGGGGIYNDGGVVTVSEATIANNSATGTSGSGGGLLNVNGTLNVRDSIISGNSALRAGGGIETNAGTVTLANTTLGGADANAGNTTGAAPGNGGGLHTTGAGDVTLNGGSVQNNTAAREGGGLWNSDTGTLKVSGTNISSNIANGNDGENGGGGGIYNDGGTTNVTNATIANNIALAEAVGNGGGGIFNNGILNVTTSTISSNTANANQASTGRGNGGGILNTAAGTATITGGTIASNLAARAGGGVENVGGTVTLTDVLLGGTEAANGNIANINGGGLHSGGGTVTVTRGVVQNNVAVQEGGGLWAAGTMNVSGTGIAQNTANGDGTKQGGGGVFVETGGITTIANTTIINNVSTAQAVGNGGGGIFNDARLSITNSNISGNTANSNQNAAGRGNGGGILNTNVGALVVNGGSITNNRTARAGGGIENVGGTVTLVGLTLNGNFANINGGGLHSGGGTVTVSDSTVQNNIATQEGGGLWAAGTMNVARGLISGNTANGDGNKQGGGGIFVETGGTTAINGTNIRANIATASTVGNGGGGIFNDATLNLTNVTLAENTAISGAGNGGGVLNSPLGALTVNGARITGNRAARAGGGVENDGGTATLNVLMLNGNSAGVNGGGLHIAGAGKVTLDKSAVYDNVASNQGGGLWNSASGSLTVTNSTLNNNVATNEGGGLYTVAGGTTSLSSVTVTSNRAGTGGGIASGGLAASLGNSIVALNTGGATPDVSGSITSRGYNLIGVATGVVGLTSTDLSGTSAAPLDPKIGPLANNGGPTATRTLLAGSPAINGGDPTVTDGVDQRGAGFPRVRAGRLDIGALELQIDAPTTSALNISTNEDTVFTFSAATFDAGFQSTNSSSQVQSVRIDSLPANGTLALNGTTVTVGQTIARADLGGLTYTPNANTSGSDAFNFSASDGFITASGETANITVVSVNDAPVANSQRLTTDNAKSLNITLTASDLDNDNLTYFIGQDLPSDDSEAAQGIDPVYGTLSGTAPNLTYTPPAGFVGRDVFTFYVSDGTTTSQQAKIEIQVTGSRGLSAGNDSYNLILGASGQAQQTGVTLLTTGVFRIAAPGILANDFRGTPATATARIARVPQNGRLQLRADGGFDYFPSAGFAGTDSFAYTISNGSTSATAQVRLIVIDRRAPELRFDTPVNGTIVQSVASIRGRVRDRESGLKSLTLLWQRFDGKFWNGSAWITTATELPLTVQGIDWAYTGNLPEPGDDPATDLLDGNYDLRVTAMDKSNNTTRITNRITVRSATPEPPTAPDFSSVRLSAGVASAANDGIALRFTGALDEVVAVNGDRYALLVNGVAVGIGNADYSENTVTLSNIGLEAGDELTLQISGLRDAEGKTLRAGTINLVAR